MSPRDWKFRVEDILDAIERVEEYTRDMSEEEFCADSKTVDAGCWMSEGRRQRPVDWPTDHL